MKKLTFIAELCQNHLGKEKYVNKMLERCAISGANIVKLQFIYSKNLAFRPEFEKGLKVNRNILAIKRPFIQEFKRLKKLELPLLYFKKFIKICETFGVEPMVTCFTREDIKKIQDLGYKYIKIASYDCASYPMIKELNKFKKVFISTGATYDDEIENTAKICKKFKINVIFLHCVTIYPTLPKDFNLARINYLKKFSKHVGYSDHSLSNNKFKNFASLSAILFGAKYIERHVTILEHKATKDGLVSINPEDIYEIKMFSKLNKSAQLEYLKKKFKINIKLVEGKINRKLSNMELLNRNYYRGRFSSKININNQTRDLFNWEEAPLKFGK
jgi:sialic acid synthase SpsE